MCRNDKVLMKYILEIYLQSDVIVETAKFELESVGRLGITLQKAKKSKWSSLIY